MDNSAFLLALTGLVPAVCDAEAGETDEHPTQAPLGEIGLGRCLRAIPSNCSPDPSRTTPLFRRS
jgi:hypothetical protein